jgi:non-specific protein-tyrosine kinase
MRAWFGRLSRRGGNGDGRDLIASAAASLGELRRRAIAVATRRSNGHGGTDPFIALQHCGRFSPEVEAYRSLRVSLELITQRRDVKSILVASPGPLDGKTTTLINLGVLWWEIGANVLLVDADLRRPTLHIPFRLPQEDGLTDLVLGHAPSLHIQKTLREGFSLVTAGSYPAKPNFLLSSAGMRQCLGLFREAADIVLIDSPPLLVVSDALTLASMVDAVLLVVRPGRTMRRDAVRAKKLLESAGANLLGVVLNMSGRPPSRYRYSQYPASLAAPALASRTIPGPTEIETEQDTYPFLVR